MSAADAVIGSANVVMINANVSIKLKNFFILRLPLFFLHATFWERQLVTYLQLQYKTYDAFLQQKVYIFRIFEYKIGNLF